MEETKAGDVVYLKSDFTIKMTVGSVEKQTAACYWFAGTEQKFAYFPLAVLIKAPTR